MTCHPQDDIAPNQFVAFKVVKCPPDSSAGDECDRS